jgi:hypothetical protein
LFEIFLTDHARSQLNGLKTDKGLARAYPKTPEKGRTGNKGEYKIRPYKAFPA